MRIDVDNKIRIPPDSLSGAEIGRIADALTFPNPALEAAKKEMTWGWDKLPSTIRLWEAQDDGTLVLPRGFARELLEIKPDIEWDDWRCHVRKDYSSWNQIVPRGQYQERAWESIVSAEQGVYRAPPGSGKTVTVLEAIRRTRQKAIVLVNTIGLAEQWRQRARDHFGYEPGLIGDGIWDERDVTIALIPTLWSRRDEIDSGFWDSFGFTCLDECHHATANTFYDLIQRFTSQWRIGVSATPDKNWNLKPLVDASLGPMFHETTREQLRDEGLLVIPEVFVTPTGYWFRFWPTHSRIKLDSGDWGCTFKGCPGGAQVIHRNNYTKLVEDLIRSIPRNMIVARRIVKRSQEGRCVLVLSRRLEHLDKLKQLYEASSATGRSIDLTGKQKREERLEIQQKAGPGDVIFSTIGDEALDIPQLDSVVLAYPTRNTDILEQQVGRIERVYNGKLVPTVDDFADDAGPLRGQLNGRIAKYEQEGYQTCYDDN